MLFVIAIAIIAAVSFAIIDTRTDSGAGSTPVFTLSPSAVTSNVIALEPAPMKVCEIGNDQTVVIRLRNGLAKATLMAFGTSVQLGAAKAETIDNQVIAAFCKAGEEAVAKIMLSRLESLMAA